MTSFLWMTAAGLFVASIAAPAQTKATPQAKQSEQAAAEKQRKEAWRKEIMKAPRPSKGCFTAVYPEKTWRTIPCKPSTPHKLYLPRRGSTSRLDIVGGVGPDFSATVTGHISEAEGSFDSISGLAGAVNPYSLQLNTAPFSTSACSGSPSPGTCLGWEQFVYEGSGGGYIQYWLLEYGPAGTLCPLPRHAACAADSSYSDGWCPFQFDPAGPVYCVINSVGEASAPGQVMSALNNVKVTGAAPGVAGSATDSMVVSVSVVPFGAAGNNYFPDLGSQWNEVEFNAFGGGGGSQATFPSPSTVVVRTEVTSGTTSGPGCHLKSWTGESNSMTLNNTPPLSVGPLPAPALVFTQVNPAPSGALATCADAISLGDTHLTTFRGLLYDFQAKGDFLLAETGPGFRVETRQVSGAPTWPDAAVNKAVAVQAGKSQVAICLPDRLVVDGKPATIPADGRLALSDGGYVFRKGSNYVVLAPTGDSIRAAMNGTHIDVAVGLGNWPSNVRGLLANANGNVKEVAARDGAVLQSPFQFESLYGHYMTSWLVPSSGSMLSACGERVAEGRPAKPFFPNDLNPDLAKRNQAICAGAGLKQGPLMDACIIDVAMLGAKAAQAYAHMRSPVAVGDARKK
jgi:hypothetical protein